MAEYKFHGIKRIGHGLKALLPISVFKPLLKTYHGFVAWGAVPKSWLAHRRMERTIVRLREEARPIRFGFYVVLESMFQLRRVFELMLEDPRFDPFVVVAPRIGWQREDLAATVNKTYDALVRDFGAARVYKGYHDGVFENHLEDCDACAMMNLYRGLADGRFETEHFAMKGVPVFGAAYFYVTGNIHGPEYYSMSSLKYVHTFFASNEYERGWFIKGQNAKRAERVVRLTGCVKTDAIEHVEQPREGGKKTILIATHHTAIKTVDSGMNIGNFFRLKDFLKDLPKRYSSIHWIFRPHPHLRLRLIKEAGWTEEQWDAYVRDFTASSNAEYEDGGAYYESFARSDAIIQDCGSFLPEYFYTGKPQCYMLASEESKKEQFDAWGQELLAHTYQAFSENDITRFIEDVVIGGNDSMREMRLKFAKEKVMVNYPYASETALEMIAETLGRGKGKKK